MPVPTTGPPQLLNVWPQLKPTNFQQRHRPFLGGLHLVLVSLLLFFLFCFLYFLMPLTAVICTLPSFTQSGVLAELSAGGSLSRASLSKLLSDSPSLTPLPACWKASATPPASSSPCLFSACIVCALHAAVWTSQHSALRDRGHRVLGSRLTSCCCKSPQTRQRAGTQTSRQTDARSGPGVFIASRLLEPGCKLQGQIRPERLCGSSARPFFENVHMHHFHVRSKLFSSFSEKVLRCSSA